MKNYFTTSRIGVSEFAMVPFSKEIPADSPAGSNFIVRLMEKRGETKMGADVMAERITETSPRLEAKIQACCT